MNNKKNINLNSYVFIVVFILFIIEIIFYLGFKKKIGANEQFFLWLFVCFNVSWGIIYGFLDRNRKKITNYYLKIIASPNILFGVIVMLVLSLFTLIQINDSIKDSLSLRSSFIGLGLSFLMVFLWVGGPFSVGYISVKLVKLLEKLLFKKYFN